MHCRICGRPIPAGGTGRPRLYCSPACRQRAYRGRRAVAEHPAGAVGVLGSVAGQLRENADLIVLLCTGWAPPADADGVTLARLLADTDHLATQLRELGALLTDSDGSGVM
ncbi:MAG TPA: hypothetical protein VH352_13655 [Pseudonocardiaceae bacterium]|jgi:hypothetical protein|nr:hypothetical protein [Pseudonocardiaceae bacterium]